MAVRKNRVLQLQQDSEEAERQRERARMGEIERGRDACTNLSSLKRDGLQLVD